MPTKAPITFNAKQVTKKLLKSLPERAQDILTRRFGLGKETTKETLESIGQSYGITRERVRQIEEYAIKNIRKSDEYTKEQEVFTQLHTLITQMGGLVSEFEFLSHLSKSESVQNHAHFLLVVGDEFSHHKENEHFSHRWSIDSDLAQKIHDGLKSLYKNLSNEDLLSEKEIVDNFITHIGDVAEEYKEEEIIKRWLSVSKKIGKNPLGEWGKSDSPNVNVKGMRDYAYLVIRRHGSPIHFREVAQQIEKLFGKKAHVATTHNELIKDKRFVLVGRGLYALADWGYLSGVVRDVIKQIIEDNGPITKDDIVDRVLKERYVKENTILVNLQNPKHFTKDTKGRYNLVK